MASLRIPFSFALALAACGGSSDDTAGDTGSTGDTHGSSSTNPTTTMSATTTSMTDTTMSGSESSGSATTSNDTSSGSSESGSADSASSSGGPAESSSSSGGAPSVCDPEDGDSDCVTCTKTSCCGQLTGCLNMPDCATVYDCLDGINEPTMEEQMTCASDNGVDFNTISAFLQQVYQCRMGACPTDCPA